MVERRNGEQRLGRKGVNPVGDEEGVALGLPVAQAIGLVVLAGLLPVVEVGVIGNLEVVLTVLRVQAQLIFGRLIPNQGNEAALGVRGIVDDRPDWRCQTVIGSGARQTDILGRRGAVVAYRKLGFYSVEVACGKKQLAVAVALEAIAGQYVKDTVGAVADIGRVAAALGFEGIDVFGIDLRTYIGGNLSIGNGDAIDEPAGLMPTADVEHIVGHVGAGNIVRDHLHAKSAAGSRGLVDVDASDQGGGSYGVKGGDRALSPLDYHGLCRCSDRQRNVQNRVGPGDRTEGLFKGGKASCGNF